MLSRQEMVDIVNRCTYKPGWLIHCLTDAKNRLYVQVENLESIDSVTLQKTSWRSGKRYISDFCCRQEVVGIVFGLIKDAEFHELHEFFRYKNASIYNPHLDPDVLAEVAKKKSSFVTRKNAMSMQESS